MNPPSAQHAPSPAPRLRDAEGRAWDRQLGYSNSLSQHSNITPGVDNFGEQAAGGIAGIAMGVADTHARESGLEAMRNTPGYDPRMEGVRSPYDARMELPRSPYDPRTDTARSPYDHRMDMHAAPEYDHSYEQDMYARPAARQDASQSSLTPLGAAAFPPGISTPQARSTVSRSPHSFNHEPYVDIPYNRYSRNVDPSLEEFDPNSIEDDGDDGLEYRQHNRGSMLSLGHATDRGPSAAGAAATGGVIGALGGLVGRKASGNPAGPQYDAVHHAYGGANNYDLGEEKSEWLNQQSTGKKKLRWLLGIIVALIILGAIAGGVVGSILSKKNSSSSSSQGQSASSDTSSNGDLNKDSAEIKKLLNNKNLHKVFPGIDYTPMYTQYPGCLTYPASQNNVTRDLAVLSQLTNTIRLYGTDCNQTEMLLHSIDQLGLNGTIKVWMGVWQDGNATTNARQLSQMYDIFSKHGSASFVGVIVGNEVLYRKDMTASQLGEVISGVKSNLTSMGISLPVASSDLGDDWTAQLVSEVDYVMANIHPFFAGVTAETAAAWTWDFWQSHDVSLTSSTPAVKNIISETGWPSQGGTDCGGASSCTNGSVAGITEMNTFMDSWVCQALQNGTDYFWFEAFDEPWKISFDTTGEEWEDHWGLMDVNRNLKAGVVIPDCGGKTVS